MSDESPRQSAPVASAMTAAVVAGLASVVLRALVFRDLYAADPLLRTAVLDDAAYLEMAQRMAEGTERSWFLAPLHPWIVARLSLVFPLGLRLMGATNLILGAATSALVAVLGTRLGGREAGWIAGIAHALCAVFVFHDVLPGQEPALGLLHAGTLLAAVALYRHGRPRNAFVAGLLTGIAMLGRGTSLVLLLSAAPGLRKASRRGIVVIACLTGLGLALAPATIRNALVATRASPLPWSGGPNLYLANGPESRATVSQVSTELGSDPRSIASNAFVVPQQRPHFKKMLFDGQVSRWWMARTWRERGSVGELAAHLGKKAVLFWSAEERGSSHDIRAEREFSFWIEYTPGSGWWLLCLGSGGWWLLRRRRPEVDGIALALAGTWLMLTVFFPIARYRLPIQVLCVPLSAAAWVAAPAFWREDRRRALVAAGLVVLGGVLAHIPVRDADAGVAYANVGGAFAQQGDVGAAQKWLAKALDAAPGSGPAHQMLGQLQLAGGDAEGALEHFRAAAQDRRTRYSAQVFALPPLLLTGRVRQARAAANGLLGERPDDPLLLAYAAWAAHADGDSDESRRLLGRARRIAPDLPELQRVARMLR